MDRRTILIGGAAAALAVRPAAAQGYPDRPVRIVTAFSVGSGPDVMLRLVAERLAKTWSQPVVVENRPGGSGFIAIGEAKRAPADGQTLLHADGLNFTAVPHLYRRLPYDAANDFDPVTPLHRSHFFIAVPVASPWKTAGDLVAAARARPGEVTYGSWQIGSVAHLGGAALEAAAGVRMNHVPFKENAQLYSAVANNDVNWAFGSPGSAGPLQRAGKLRFLAFAAPQRLTGFPDVPTVSESGGPGAFEVSGWVGLFARRGAPAAATERIGRDFARIAAEPDVQAKLVEFGYHAFPLAPAEAARLVRAESPHYARIVQRSAISLD